MIKTVLVPSQIIDETLVHLQTAGREDCECVVLWLGSRGTQGIRVMSCWKPEQEADYDHFRIPESSMEKLMRELRMQRLMVAAQVHSHPKLAFHSRADDKWAIVRHEGALSLVLPDFALRTTTETFVEHTAVFTLSDKNRWMEATKSEIHKQYRILP
jgi:proteasome lid subunit RPN8/RPN11